MVAEEAALTQSKGEDWPRFLGMRGDNTSNETGLLDKWPTNGPPILWERAIGTGYGAPSVRGEMVVIHHRLKDDEVVEAFEPETGNPVWRYAYPSHYIDPYGYNNGPRCTPLLTSNLCYTFGAEGRLLCLKLKTGELVWQREPRRDFTVPEALFGVGSTPILESDLLIAMVGGQPDSGLVAFDAKTGRTVWESVGEKNWQGRPKTGWRGEPHVDWSTADQQASYSSPIAATIHGKRHILALMRQGLVSVDPKTGTVNFSFWFRSPTSQTVTAMNPVVAGDLILISAAYYKIGAVLLRVRPDGQSVEPVWRSLALEMHWSTPILHEGHVYAFSGRHESDASFRCVELQSGKVRWERKEDSLPHNSRQPSAYGRGSTIMADGKIIALGERGLLGLFNPSPNVDEEICRWQVPSMHYPCWAAPVLSRRKLYLRNDDRLVCLNLAR